MPGSRAAGLGQDHQRFLQDHDERARARPAGQAARDAAIMDSYPRSDLRVLVRLFPGHNGQSDDRVLQQPRDRPASDLPADFCRGYRGPKIAVSMEAAEHAADWRSLLALCHRDLCPLWGVIFGLQRAQFRGPVYPSEPTFVSLIHYVRKPSHIRIHTVQQTLSIRAPRRHGLLRAMT